MYKEVKFGTLNASMVSGEKNIRLPRNDFKMPEDISGRFLSANYQPSVFSQSIGGDNIRLEDEYMEQYVEYHKVHDRAFVGRETNLV